MKPAVDRRRFPDVPRPNGERWTDKLISPRRHKEMTTDEGVWLWGAKLWAAAAIAGTAYGIGWLQGLGIPRLAARLFHGS